MKKNFYAVKVGRKSNVVVSTWTECESLVTGFNGAQFKGFATYDEAIAYLNDSVPCAMVGEYDVTIYVDGSCGGGKVSWAFVVYRDNTRIYEDSGLVSTDRYPDVLSMNNVAGELAAAMRAVKWASDNNIKIRLVFDYTGIREWAIGSWKAKNEYTKAYVDWMSSSSMDVVSEWLHVNGHTGVEGNEYADKLCKAALKM